MRNQQHSHADKRCRFSIRKTRLCVGSVLIGLLWIGGSGQSIYAKEMPAQPVETEVVEELGEMPSPSLVEGEQPQEDELADETSTEEAIQPEAVPLVVNAALPTSVGASLDVSSTNIAIGKTYTSSGVEQGLDPSLYGADKAFDGKETTRFSAPLMRQADGSQTSQWLQIDLSQPAVIHGIEVDFFNRVFATDYSIVTSATGTEDSWELLTRQTSLTPTTAPHPMDKLTFEEPRRVQRYLRFRFDEVNPQAAGRSVSIKDIRIWGKLEAPPAGSSPDSTPVKPDFSKTSNLALKRPAKASAHETGTDYEAAYAVDGRVDTRFSAGQMKKGQDPHASQTPQWLQIDLGAAANLTAIELDFYRKVYATDYLVSTSDDQETWKVIAKSQQLSASSTLENPTDKLVFEQGREVGRYLRLTFNKVNHYAAGTGVSVTEVRVLGERKGEIAKEIDPVEKLAKASLVVSDGRVVLAHIEEDADYSYEIIGSANQYLVSHDGQLSSYNLNDQEVTMLVAARKRSTKELVNSTKVNKTIRIAANHRESVTGQNTKPVLALDIQEFLAGQGMTKLEKTDKLFISPAYSKQGQLFNGDLRAILGFELAQGSEEEAKVIFKLTDQYHLKDEGYLIRIGDKVEVYAGDAKAFNYAAVTLAQMLQVNGELTRGVYRDYPNYAIRGMLLDVARIPMRMEFLKDVSKLFRWYKLNELHLHFNDNQWPAGSKADVEAWKKTEAAHRLESSRFPSLHKADFKHDRYEGEYDFYREIYGNPSYSREAFRLFQADSHAAAINILAEIDTPGHSAAYSLYALENPDQIDYLGQPIHHPNDLEALAINETSYPERTARAKRFVRELITDYLQDNLFSYGHIHLGVDEYWQKSGNVEAFLTYLNELNALAKSKGKTLRTWGALSQFRGKTPVAKDIIFDEWTQYESLTLDRINEGYRVVNVPQPFTYVTPGRNHKDIINEQFVFDHWQPTLFNLNYNGKRQEALLGEPLLLGAKGALWGDEHAEGIEESDLYHRLEKSLSMIGYKTWGGRQGRSYLDYQRIQEATRLKRSTLSSQSEVLVHLHADHASADKLIDLSGNGHLIRAEGGLHLVKNEQGSWFHFTGDNYLVTDMETIDLPYTLEMTIKPTDGMSGSLLLSRDGALYLNKKGYTQEGAMKEGLMFNRYFYAQHICPHLEAGKEYRLTFAATRQVLTVYINGEKVATYAHQNETEASGSARNLRTSFNLPFREIGKGFKGYIKDIKVYNQTSSKEEIERETLSHRNIALHKPVYDYRHHSDFWNQAIRPYHRDKVTDGEIDAGEGRWNSSDHDEDYLIVDLGRPQAFSRLALLFDSERPAADFKILVSDDLENFREIHHQTGNQATSLDVAVGQQQSRYIKFESKRRKAGKNEIAIKEWRIYQEIDQTAKATLATGFATKKVDWDNPDWLAVFNILHNKYASTEVVTAMLGKLAGLSEASKQPPVETPPKEDTPAHKVALENRIAAIEARPLSAFDQRIQTRVQALLAEAKQVVAGNNQAAIDRMTQALEELERLLGQLPPRQERPEIREQLVAPAFAEDLPIYDLSQLEVIDGRKEESPQTTASSLTKEEMPFSRRQEVGSSASLPQTGEKRSLLLVTGLMGLALAAGCFTRKKEQMD